MLGFIIRNSRDFTNIEIFQLLFKTYVIPCLEYACLVWNPFYQCHVTSIEAVQRKFLIYLHFKVFGAFPLVGTHNHILREQFNFLSLANRRKIIILLFLHKLIHYRIDCADLLQRLCFCIPRVNNRNVLPLYAAMPRSNTLLRANLGKLLEDELLEISCSKVNCSNMTLLEVQVPRTAVSRKCFARK
jgi:predicted metallopeptidase